MLPLIHRFKGEAKVCVLGDFHVGNVAFDEPLLDKMLDAAIKDGYKLILMGDFCESINVTDRRFDWDTVDRERINPQEQYDYVREKLEPFKGQILGVLTGNHDDKLRKDNGGRDWVERELCRPLKAPYLGYTNMLRVKVDDFHKDFMLWHGRGKGYLSGSKINRLQRLAQGFNTDVYCMGHTHRLWSGSDAVIEIEQQGRTVIARKRPRFFILTGGFLQGYKTVTPTDYIAYEAFGPLRLGCTFIRIAHGKIGIQQVGED